MPDEPTSVEGLSERDKGMTRRDFLKKTAVAGAAAVGAKLGTDVLGAKLGKDIFSKTAEAKAAGGEGETGKEVKAVLDAKKIVEAEPCSKSLSYNIAGETKPGDEQGSPKVTPESIQDNFTEWIGLIRDNPELRDQLRARNVALAHLVLLAGDIRRRRSLDSHLDTRGLEFTAEQLTSEVMTLKEAQDPYSHPLKEGEDGLKRQLVKCTAAEFGTAFKAVMDGVWANEYGLNPWEQTDPDTIAFIEEEQKKTWERVKNNLGIKVNPHSGKWWETTDGFNTHKTDLTEVKSDGFQHENLSPTEFKPGVRPQTSKEQDTEAVFLLAAVFQEGEDPEDPFSGFTRFELCNFNDTPDALLGEEFEEIEQDMLIKDKSVDGSRFFPVGAAQEAKEKRERERGEKTTKESITTTEPELETETGETKEERNKRRGQNPGCKWAVGNSKWGGTLGASNPYAEPTDSDIGGEPPGAFKKKVKTEEKKEEQGREPEKEKKEKKEKKK
jgi:hypothetical protein